MSEENGNRYSVSRFRRRVYERRFDWELAREMHKKGHTFAHIARTLGVDRRGVARVVKLPASRVKSATDEQILGAGPGDRIPCPRCMGPMTPKSELCRDCRSETRLQRMTLERVPGTPGNSYVELRDVEPNRIVEVDGSWGVLCRNRPDAPSGYRLVDFWEFDAEYVHERTRVRVRPSTRVVVGGVSEEEEEIEA